MVCDHCTVCGFHVVLCWNSPSLLVLDEATSALDTITEKKIQVR
jgi:ABC-type transport system involved in Fe-S cluster assembly fused permease/ATPase subunit